MCSMHIYMLSWWLRKAPAVRLRRQYIVCSNSHKQIIISESLLRFQCRLNQNRYAYIYTWICVGCATRPLVVYIYICMRICRSVKICLRFGAFGGFGWCMQNSAGQLAHNSPSGHAAFFHEQARVAQPRIYIYISFVIYRYICGWCNCARFVAETRKRPWK